MAIAMALLGFNDLGRSVTPTFLYKTILFTIIYTLPKNEQKNQCGKVKNITITVHEYCHHAAARRVKLWSLNANLFF